MSLAAEDCTRFSDARGLFDSAAMSSERTSPPTAPKVGMATPTAAVQAQAAAQVAWAAAAQAAAAQAAAAQAAAAAAAVHYQARVAELAAAARWQLG